jgi:Zn-dependent M28 family amino/carboxypeptidase
MNIGETKSDVARKQGAVAILTVRTSTSLAPRPSTVVKSGPTSGSAVTGMRPAGQDRMTVPHMLVNPQPDVPTAAISERVADMLLRPLAKTVATFHAAHVSAPSASIEVPGVRVQLRRALAENTIVETRNVIGMIEGRDPGLKDEYVLITAHYDHVGAGGPEIFRGADDNASGTAAAIAIADAFANGPRPDRSVVFLVFEAEEDGMLGSAYYARHPLLPLAKAVAVLNMDMIGRDEQVPGLKGVEPVQNAVNLVGTLYSPDLRSVVEHANRSVGLGLDYKTDTNGSDWFGRSDHISFAARGVPIVMFNTGEHPDYHTPNDTADRLNYEKMQRITRLVYLTARSLTAATSARPRFVTPTNSGAPARPQPR